MKCPECQFENREGAKFCIECGEELVLDCPQCGKAFPISAKFCDECGHGLGEPGGRGEPLRDAEGERKHVTVLFSDLSGYTAMTEQLDPEDVKEILGRIFGEIAQVIAKYEGFMERPIGDAAMAIFGVPRAHEDDPVRAIKAAMEIHELVGDLSSQFERKTGGPYPCIAASIPVPW
jgi:class 3 adenylate cyclase